MNQRKETVIKEQTRRCMVERIAEIQHELVVGEDCAGMAPEIWKVVEEELLDELRELELSLLIIKGQGRRRD